MLRIILLVGAFGALGAIARFSLSELVYRGLGRAFPFGTLVVNGIGCLLIGLVAHVALTTDAISTSWRVALVAGFLGSLTTFSTFGYETFEHLARGNLGIAVGNMLLSVGIGLLAVWAGIALARYLVG